MQNYLITASYTDSKELGFLFDKSKHVIDFIGANDVAEHVFVSIVTEEQLKELELSGVRPIVLISDPDLNNIAYLYNIEPNQAQKLAQYGKVYPITLNNTLLEVFPGTKLEYAGELTNFQIVPIDVSHVKPEALITQTEQPPAPIAQTKQTDNLLIWITGGIILAISLFIVLRKVTHKPSSKSAE